MRRVEHVFVVDEADARAADRAHEGRAGQGERRRRRHHRDDVGIVLLIVRQHGDDHLGVAAPAVGEQRTDRAVDQARGQRVLFGRTAFALEVAAGNAAGRVVFLVVVDGERQEVDAGLRLLGRDHGGDDGGFAVGGDDGAVGLARDLAGFEGELAATPVELNTMDIEHCDFLSWFSRRGESHEQDGETLSRAAEPRARTASGDPAMAFEPPLRRTGAVWRPVQKSAALSLPVKQRTESAIRTNARETRAALFSGGCQASRSASCSAPRRCAGGNRATGGAATRASAARAASGCPSRGS